MPQTLELAFDDLKAKLNDTAVVFAAADAKLGSWAKKLDKATDGQISRAIKAAEFKGKAKSALDVVGVHGCDAKRVLVIGVGNAEETKAADWVELGGYVSGQLIARKAKSVSVAGDLHGLDSDATMQALTAICEGLQLRCYSFDKYQTQSKNDEARPGVVKSIAVLATEPDVLEAAFRPRAAVCQGVALARDLVNEPANRLGPAEFADICADLSKVGVEVDILDDEMLDDERMHALLAVAQGSVRPARVALMRWTGAKSKRAKPLCFIGKGVCFDTGGISIKPASGMEDMKGDMGGAACVVGLMHALAARKAAVNAVGLVGLVENMPSGDAMRPGDVIGSRAGKTIEVINTDAEGRLVLADLLSYAEETYAPKLMINLATLTGAIIVALGKDNAGLFSNDDNLAKALTDAGLATGEHVWRLPLGKGYDKQLDSKTADMKNVGGRAAGSITAAQFLQRFVDDTAWAHLDIAGVAFDSPKSEVNPSWGSGWGVRMLEQFVAAQHEKSSS